MRKMRTFRMGSITVALIAAVVLLAWACANDKIEGREYSPSVSANLSDRQHSVVKWMEENPCGVLHIRPPLFNVSGYFTANIKPNTSLFVFVTPDTTFAASLYVVEHCRPIGRVRIQDRRRFRLGPLPQGNYVVMVDGRSFERGQRFPFVDPINDSNFTLTMVFHGGTSRYSMAAFSIQPKAQRSNAGIPESKGKNG